MTTAIMKYEALSEILLPLAEEFEKGNRHGFRLDPLGMEKSGPLTECIAELIAEGWLDQCYLAGRYRLTEAGYKHFEARLRALRTLAEVGVA